MPSEIAAAREGLPADPASLRNDHASVLVVDDDPEYGPFVVRALERIGIASTLAKDGITALKLARRRPPRLVLLDLTLPGLHGFQVLRSLRNDPRTVDARVIVITGLTTPRRRSGTRPTRSGQIHFSARHGDERRSSSSC